MCPGGTPIICGGGQGVYSDKYSDKCFKYSYKSDIWSQSGVLPGICSYAGVDSSKSWGLGIMYTIVSITCFRALIRMQKYMYIVCVLGGEGILQINNQLFLRGAD